MRVARLETCLLNHPDCSFVNTLLHNMRYGARISYAGDRSFLIANNLCSAYTSPNHVSEYLTVECAAGRMASPYPSLPHPSLRCSRIGLVPKKSGKLRLIMHLSAPQGLSNNDGISKDEFSLHCITVYDAVRLMHKHEKGARLAKVDLQNAFRLCPVSPADWPLLSIDWEGQYYVDKVLPFGLHSSPFLFNMLADALCWVCDTQIWGGRFGTLSRRLSLGSASKAPRLCPEQILHCLQPWNTLTSPSPTVRTRCAPHPLV